jgi:hypothetical protein
VIKDETKFVNEVKILNQIENYSWGQNYNEIIGGLTPERFIVNPGFLYRIDSPPHIKISAKLLVIFSNLVSFERFIELSIRFTRQIDIKVQIMKSNEGEQTIHTIKVVNSVDYVNKKRIEELRKINNIDFDLAKLIRLCEELNNNWQNGNYYSVIAIVRTILNHSSTAFGFTSFQQVVNNYNGGQSFKKIANDLFNSAKNIADNHLHGQMQKTDPLPNDTQVDFKSHIDFLLAELIKVLK